MAGCSGCCKEVGRALIRSRPLDDHETMMDSPLKRNLGIFHLLMYGIGTMIGNSIYGVIAVVSRKYTGPSTFVCFMIAAVIGFLNGMNYSELSAQIPKSGSAFVYTYVIAGEFMAFMAGWLALLEYISTASSAAVLAANTIDILSNGTLYELFKEHIGELPASGILNDFPNLLAFGLCVFATVLLTCGNDASFLINCILSVVTIVIISIASVFMYTKFDKTNMISESRDEFLPRGIEGLLSGSGIAFGTFIGFEAMTVAGEEVKDPQRSIPKATLIAICLVGILTIFYSLSFTGYTPWWEVHANMGLAAVFFSPPVTWLRILVCCGTIAAAFCSMLCSIYAITRIIYSMAADGLIFTWFGWIHPTLKVPLIALYCFGVLLGLIAIFFDYAALTSFMSISAVLTYIIVACDLLVLRFMKPELYHNEAEPDVGYLYDSLNTKFMRKQARGLVPCIALGCFMVSSAALLYFCLDAEEFILDGYAWAAAVLTLLLIISLSSFVLITLHRPFTNWGKGSTIFKVPFVPFVPLICIFLDIAVIIKLPSESWVRVAFWIALGMILYFAYGVWHSSIREPIDSTSGDHEEISGTNSPLTSGSKDTMESDEKSAALNSDLVIEANERTPIVK